MNVLAGTSGFSYKEWKGHFYPEDLPASEMLGFYSTRLPTVEVNNTFYRLPKPEVLRTWREQTTADFKFVVKASRRITHFKRLLNAGDTMDYMFGLLEALESDLGAVLFQLPPNFRKNIDRLNDFLPHVPGGVKCAFEFRHESWFDDEVYDALGNANCALCVADTTSDDTTDIVRTSDWGYLRLRRPEYSADELKNWAERLNDSGWSDAFVFFKHEDEGAGPRLAEDFLSIVDSVKN